MQRRTWWMWAAPWLGAVAWRGWLMVDNRCPTFDGTYYLRAAGRLLNDGAVDYGNFPPGWPIFIAAFAPLFGGSDPAALLRTAEALNVVAAIASAVLLFLLARPLVGGAWAMLPATTLLLVPTHLAMSFVDLSDMSYLTAVLAALVLWQRERWFAAGFGLGVAFVIRPEAVMILFVLAVVAAARPRRLGWLLLGWAGPFVAYQVFGWVQTGEWVGSSKRNWLLATFRNRTSDQVWDLVAGNLRQLGSHLVRGHGWPILGFAVVALFRRPGVWASLALPGLALPFFSFAMAERYLLSTSVAIVLAAAVSVARLSRPWRRVGVGLWIVSLLLTIPALHGASRTNAEEFVSMKAAGEYLRGMAEPHEVVAGRKPYVSFWAQLPFHRVPRKSTTRDLEIWLRENEISYVFGHAGISGATQAKLRAMARDGVRPQSVELIDEFRHEDQSADTTYLYRVLPRRQR